MVDEGFGTSGEHDEIRERLRPFLIRNPETEISPSDTGLVVSRPWGDDSIELRLDVGGDDLIGALNAVRLPPRFTAVWHDDKSELEVIYTAMPLDDDTNNRRFEFRLEGHSYRCSFEPSSDRLMTIAHSSRPLGISSSGYRNLQSLFMFVHSQEHHPDTDIARLGSPTSFMIRGIPEYDTDKIIELIENLNFYMRFFDRETPLIIVHDAPLDLPRPALPDRYPTGTFPSILSGQRLDQHLLGLWDSASTGDTFLRFIHYYQILEYAAFYYIREDTMQTIRKIITAPDAATRPQAAAQEILEALVPERTQDEAKIDEVIRRCVEPRELWNEFSSHREIFSREVELDGGFTLPTVISSSSDVDAFVGTWHPRFSQALRRIRNGLVHARESRQSTMIAPTRSNHDRLLPWLAPLSFTAARVMVYSNL